MYFVLFDMAGDCRHCFTLYNAAYVVAKELEG